MGDWEHCIGHGQEHGHGHGRGHKYVHGHSYGQQLVRAQARDVFSNIAFSRSVASP